MSDITKLFEGAIRQEIGCGGGATPYRQSARAELREVLGRCIGQDLTEADMRRLDEARAFLKTGDDTIESCAEFAVKAIRERIARVLADHAAGPGGGNTSDSGT